MIGVKKNLNDVKGKYVEQLHKVLWSYHTTPNSTTKETPFTLVYGEAAMFPVEIETST